jgi:hypothetical protein
MSTPGKDAEGIPMLWPAAADGAEGPQTVVRPGHRPKPVTARETALEATIQKIRGCATMARLEAAGIHYELRTNSWRITIGGCLYDRSDLAEIIAIIGRLGTPEKPEKEKDNGKK